MLGKPFHLTLLPPLLLVTVGLALCAYGELVFSTLGFVCVFVGCLSRAAKATLQQALMTSDDVKLGPLEMLVWTSIPCLVIMTVWSLLSEGLEPFYAVNKVSTVTAILITIVNALILQLAALYVLKELGAVAQQLAGQLKGLLSLVGSVAAFGEEITLMQFFGYGCIISGIYWYNRKDLEIKKAAAPNCDSSSETKAESSGIHGASLRQQQSV